MAALRGAGGRPAAGGRRSRGGQAGGGGQQEQGGQRLTAVEQAQWLVVAAEDDDVRRAPVVGGSGGQPGRLVEGELAHRYAAQFVPYGRRRGNTVAGVRRAAGPAVQFGPVGRVVQ